MSRVPLVFVHSGLALALSMGCVNRSGSGTQTNPPTLIRVDPAEFAPNVPCVVAGPGMRRYVATLFDVTPDQDGGQVDIPSAPPVACHLAVNFGFVVPGRKYRAEIDAYEEDELTPLSTGNRIQAHEGRVVNPRWRATCGVGLDHRDEPGGAATDAGFSLTEGGLAPLDDAARDAPDRGDADPPRQDAGVPETLFGPAEAIEARTVTLIGCTAFAEIGD